MDEINIIIKTLNYLLPTNQFVKIEDNGLYTIFEDNERTTTQNMTVEFMTDLIKKLERDKEINTIITDLKKWGEVDESATSYYIEVEGRLFKADKTNLYQLKEISKEVEPLIAFSRRLYPFIYEEKNYKFEIGGTSIELVYKKKGGHINIIIDNKMMVDFPNLDPYYMSLVNDRIFEIKGYLDDKLYRRSNPI